MSINPKSIMYNLLEFLPHRSTRNLAKVLREVQCGYNGINKYSTTILDLPNELLLMIFKLLSQDDLVCNVTFVCQRWQELTVILWTKIHMKAAMPKKMIQTWLNRAPLLKHLVIYGRRDLNEILKLVCQHCKEVETIQLYYCSGSRRNSRIRGSLMCDLLVYCPRLTLLHLKGTRMNSSKFFRLLPHARNTITRNVSYVGSITCRELSALLESIKPVGKESSLLNIRTDEGQHKYVMDLRNISMLLALLKHENKDHLMMIMWSTVFVQKLYNTYFTVQNFSFSNLL